MGDAFAVFAAGTFVHLAYLDRGDDEQNRTIVVLLLLSLVLMQINSSTGLHRFRAVMEPRASLVSLLQNTVLSFLLVIALSFWILSRCIDSKCETITLLESAANRVVEMHRTVPVTIHVRVFIGDLLCLPEQGLS